MRKHRIKLTAFNVSLAITPFLMLLAYRERGYFACGSEILAPVVGLLIHRIFKEY